MSTATHTATTTATTVDTHENIINKLTAPMKMFDSAHSALGNLSNIGMITDVTFANPIKDMISGIARVMEVYPPRRMVTYGQ